MPIDTFDTSVAIRTVIIEPVVTTAISRSLNYVGFQGDFTYDSAVVSFSTPQVQSAGLTASNWSVSANILNTGPGTIKTLRISAFSLDFTPLNGSGTLFELRMLRVSSTPGATSPLVWAADPNNFIFIDDNLGSHTASQTNGLITITGATPTPTPPPTPTPTPTPEATPTPTPPPTPTPTPINISGTISYCSDPDPGPVPNVTLTLTGDATTSVMTDGSGNYQFSSLAAGWSYTVTPRKSALTPGSPGINTVDVIATQRYFLNIGTPLSGCRLKAADVSGDNIVNTIDVVAIQRFFLGRSTGIANTGRYQFTPASRTYSWVASNQTDQNYDALVFGDVASTFVHRPEGPSQTAADDRTSVSALSGLNTSAGEVPATVAAVTLPGVAQSRKRNFIVAVRTTAIDAKNNLVGFQGDFTFDERVVTFQSPPVSNAGLTGGNWNVSGNVLPVLPGAGPIRTLRISAFSNDFTALSGSGTLFELRITRVSQAAQRTQLIWAAPPDDFIFIDADLKTQRPGYAASGSLTISISSVGRSR